MSAQPRTIAIEVTVPDPAWKVTINEVYVAGDRILVLSSLSRDPEALAAQVISRASDSVRVPAPDLPIEHYVLGKTFRWAADPHHFIGHRREVEEKLKGAERIYPRRP